MLSNDNFNELEKCLAKEKSKRSADRYFGLMLNSDELENLLKTRYLSFAVHKTELGTKAVIFDSEAECKYYCTLMPEYSPMDFDGFKQTTGEKWKNPHYYYPQKRSNWIVYIDGDLQ